MDKDVSGLPDVPGLAEFVAQDQDKAQASAQPAPPAGDKVNDYDEQMLKKFQNPKETLKHFKEIQSFATKMATEKKTAEEALKAKDAEMAQLREEVEMRQPHSVYQQTPFYSEEERAALRQEIKNELTVTAIREVIEEEKEKAGGNPAAFWNKWGIVQQLAQDYPHYTESAKGTRKLFEKAEEISKKMTRDVALKAIEDLPDDYLAKLKQRMDKTTQPQVPFTAAYMPETTSATRIGSEKLEKDMNIVIDEAAKRGDVDATLDAIFKAALAK